jgi:predicted MFS family arabinose efflux permease
MKQKFTKYQMFIVAMLAFLQFTIILDFMIMSPLGAILMPALNITPAQFGLVVSAYAFSAGASGLLASGFADRYDRKRLLLFFYTGFVLGTLFCALSPTYEVLLIARIVTGIFGGVLGSIVMAITTDLFEMNMRGRVMGFIQTAFAGSQILGIPIGLLISAKWGWHAPFLMIVGVSTLVGIAIIIVMKPIDEHLKLQKTHSALKHMANTISTPRYLMGFALTALLTIGGFMLMPFSSAFTVNNMGISLTDLPTMYLFPGIVAMFAGPIIGRFSDKVGHVRMFTVGSIFSVTLVIIYTHLGITPLIWGILVSSLMLIAMTSRMIPSQALTSALPDIASRGSYMSVSSSIQQVSGGIASIVAGYIITADASGKLQHFEVIGYVIAVTTFISGVLIVYINRTVTQSASVAPTATMH